MDISRNKRNSFFARNCVDLFPVRQINLHKSTVATNNFVLEAAGCEDHFIACLQEPHEVNGRLVDFPPQANLHHGPGVKPRAAILGSKGLNLWFVPDFSSGDQATCLWRTGNPGIPEVYVSSLYMDIDTPLDRLATQEMRRLVDHCRKEKKPLIICADSNAHSELWGNDVNRRGEALEEFIFAYDLELQNVGRLPTFTGRGAKTMIDITLTLNIDPIIDWRVSQEPTFSDHNLIQFELDLQVVNEKIMIKDLKSTDWSIFRERLEERMEGPDVVYWSKARLDKEAEKLEHCVQVALDQSVPVRYVSNCYKRKEFWSQDLIDARRRMRSSAKAFRRTGRERDKEKYLDCRKIFRKMLRQAKLATWQKYCNETKDAKGMARLNKVIQGTDNKNVGLLKYTSGQETTSPEQVLDLLLDTHFPGSVGVGDELGDQDETDWTTLEEVEDSVDFIDANKVTKAIWSFGPEKAAGPDGFKPVVLRNLGNYVLSKVVLMFKACLALQYTPKIWRQARVVFAPKVGKDDYSLAKAFRPISLTPFLFKALERVVLWELEEKTLSQRPLSKNQHAFRKGSSTESALSDMVDDVESTILRGGYAIGVFLDIQGAFDNLDTEAAIRGMREKHLPEAIIGWYGHYLRTREVAAEVKGQKGSRRLTRGTPQGGVLSPLIWNLAFDELLDLYSTGPVRVRGFADDASLLVTGTDPNVLAELMQPAVDKAVRWGARNGLVFGAAKTVAVLFTHRRIKKLPKKLKVDGTRIKYSGTAKYLGITLDTKLTFRAHILDKLQKAKNLLLRVKRGVGKLWGPIPGLMRWAYTGIIRPMITYGAIVWANKAPLYRTQFARIQRLAMMSLAHFRKGTPTAGLDVICGLPPLDIFVGGEAAKAAKRIQKRNRPKWDGIGAGNKRGHLRWIRNNYEIEGGDIDVATPKFQWGNNFSIDYDSFGKGEPLAFPDLGCYTDGSHIDGNTGWGFCARDASDLDLRKKGSLGEKATVFQAEIYAIDQAARYITNLEGRSVVIHVDSQAALLALDKYITTSITVQNCIEALNILGTKMRVTLRWVKAHVGHPLNELADELAKEGAAGGGDHNLLPLSMAVFKDVVQKTTQRRWANRWEQDKAYRQTKIWFPVPQNRVKHFMMLSRAELGVMVQFITGHNYLNYHMNNVDKSTNPLCRLCGENVETSWHLISDCPVLWAERFDIFGWYEPPEPLKWTVVQLSRFLQKDRVGPLLVQRGGE